MKYAISIYRITILSCMLLTAMCCLFDIPMESEEFIIEKVVATKAMAIVLFISGSVLYARWSKKDVLISSYDKWCKKHYMANESLFKANP